MKRRIAFTLLAFASITTLASCTNKKDDKHTHSYTIVDKVDSTCTEEGHDAYYTCSCGEIFDTNKNQITKVTTINKKNHEYTKHLGLYAAISTDGLSTYYTCDNCDNYFNSEKAIITPMNQDKDRIKAYIGKEYSGYIIGRDIEIYFSDSFKEGVSALEEKITKTITDQVLSYADLSEMINEYYYYTSLIYADMIKLDLIFNFYNNPDYKALHTECSIFYNNMYYFVNEMPIAISKSIYRKDYFKGYTDSQIDEIIGNINVEENKEISELLETLLNLEYDYFAGDVDKYEFVNQTKYYGNKYARLLGYNNYLDAYYKMSFDREYLSTDIMAFKEDFVKYIVPYYKKIQQAYYDKKKSVTKEQLKLFNDMMWDVGFYNYFDSFDGYYKKLGGSIYENYKSVFENGDYYISTEGSDIFTAAATSYTINDVTEYMLVFTGEYADTKTFVHEFGHSNADRHGNFTDFDLLEIHSQGDEILYALYLLNSGIVDKDVAELYLAFELYCLISGVVGGYLICDLENYIYSTEGSLTKTQIDTYVDQIQELYGCESEWNSVCQNLGYNISYSMSAFSVLDLYVTALNDYDLAASKYAKTYECYGKLDSYGYMNVCEYAGLKTMTSSENIKSFAEALA